MQRTVDERRTGSRSRLPGACVDTRAGSEQQAGAQFAGFTLTVDHSCDVGALTDIGRAVKVLFHNQFCGKLEIHWVAGLQKEMHITTRTGKSF